MFVSRFVQCVKLFVVPCLVQARQLPEELVTCCSCVHERIGYYCGCVAHRISDCVLE